MKSIKPGRGPSMMNGISSICVGVFGIIWIAAASSMGAPSFFPLFGLVFVVMAIAMAVYNFKNATGKNRYSSFDITDANEEPDPLSERFGASERREKRPADGESAFCPYCGAPAEKGFEFCNKCGKKLP